MSDDQIRSILVAIARVEGEVKGIRSENEKADELHERMDKRLTTVERGFWLIGGAVLASGGGLAALATRVLG